jgi:hypothetical protein
MSDAGGSLGASGGPSNAAGAGGADAASGGAAVSAEDCPSGTIKFRMLPDPDLAEGYLCDAGCGTGWLTITDAEGAMAYPLFSACGAASCDSCEMLACSASACLPTPVTNAGVELEWAGTYMTKDTCGANVACQRATCVKPGRYRAKACAAVNGGASSQNGVACTPKAEQVCAVAEFDFPANETIKLVLKK